jgi:hypothetical protein
MDMGSVLVSFTLHSHPTQLRNRSLVRQEFLDYLYYVFFLKSIFTVYMQTSP